MPTEIIKQYHKLIKKKIITILILFIIIVLMAIICLNIGTVHISFLNIIKSFFNCADKESQVIILNVRLPIVLAAIISGALLGLSGCVMQSILQNPMASPTTLGVSNGAVFGANFAIIVLGAGMVTTSQGTSVTINNPYIITIFAFLFSTLSSIIILLLSKKNHFRSEVIVLSGVALGSLFTAGTTLMQYFADDTKLASAIFWSFGDLSNANYIEIIIMFVLLVVSFIYFFINRWNYNAMTTGEENAKSLGVNIERVRLISLLLASLLCSTCVAFLGIIGFVGLIAPHLIKKFIGQDHRFSLISSMLTGSIILLIADALSRSLMNNVSLPIGAITSLFGAPFFLIILIKKKGNVQ